MGFSAAKHLCRLARSDAGKPVPGSDNDLRVIPLLGSLRDEPLYKMLASHALITVRGGPIIGAIPKGAKSSLVPLTDIVVVDV